MLPKVKTSFLSQLVIFYLEAVAVMNALLALWDLPGGRGEGEEKARAQQGSLREEEPAVTSRKLGRPLGGEKVRAIGPCGPPTPPLPSASGFAQALWSTELTVNVVTSGNSQRG